MSDAVLTREALLATKDAPRIVEPVEGPGGKGVVYVRAMNGEEKIDWERAGRKQGPRARDGSITYEPNFENAYGRFAVRVVSDDKGDLLFQASDAESAGKMDGAFLARVWVTGHRLAGYTDEDDKDLEAAEKNS